MGIFEAIKADDIDTVKKLIEDDPNLLNKKANKSGYSPLMCAIKNNKYEIIKHLLTKQQIDLSQISNRGLTALLMAIIKNEGNNTIVDALLGHNNIDVNQTSSRGDPPLLYAARRNMLDIINLLLEKGANIDAIKTSEGRTALHEATYQGNVGLVEKIFIVARSPHFSRFVYLKSSYK